VTLFFSAQALLMIMMSLSPSAKMGLGAGVVNSTVWSSILRTMPAWVA
jgi:hypothetical protein